MLTRALTHKSYSHEAKQEDVRDNETFEFLGDSVLGFVIGDLLFHRFPKEDEGALSKMKAYLVSATSLAAKARAYGMGEVIYLGVGEEKSGGRKKESLLANLYEAMIAAVYLDGGIDPAQQLIERSFKRDLETIDEEDLLFQDYKTALQELALGIRTRELEVAVRMQGDLELQEHAIEAQIAGLTPRIAQQKRFLSTRLAALYRLGGLSYVRLLLSIDQRRDPIEAMSMLTY